jgi:hypothetical protein
MGSAEAGYEAYLPQPTLSSGFHCAEKDTKPSYCGSFLPFHPGKAIEETLSFSYRARTEVKHLLQKEMFTLFAGQRRRLFERLVPHAFLLVSAQTDFFNERKRHCGPGNDPGCLWR